MNLELFKQICKMDQPKLSRVLTKYLYKKYDKDSIVSTPSYILVVGQIPVILVAHMDTVGSCPPQDIYHDKEQSIMWSPQLLGADDRAGVFSIIELIEQGFRPNIIFTTDEELGCVGAVQLMRDYPECPFGNIKSIIQLDRQGKQDCVFYHCENFDFIKYIEQFGFKEAFGTFSDISVLAPAWGIAAVNLSIGYLNEHTVAETLNLKWMKSTIEKVTRILYAEAEMPYFEYIGKYSNMFNFFNEPERCFICGNRVDKENKIITPDNNICCKECFKLCYC